MFTFATDYYLCVLSATIGVLQIAFSVGGIHGLLLFKSPLVARGLGFVLAFASFVCFFSTGPRNINDFQGGIDANGQALFFFLGAFTAVIFTLAAASLVNLRMTGPDHGPDAGLDSVKETGYAMALFRNLSYWRMNWRTQMKDYFSG
ncbi:hypothetical protein M1N23_02510 [Dehalococcoidia bacterium]|nr:hypothetical protein [Dehalococcoidia bacterium]